MENPLFFLLKTFLKATDSPVNWEELKFQLLSHPSFPSLHAVTGVLTHLGIDNLALEVPKDIETLEHMPPIFISLTNNTEFMLVTKVEADFEVLLSNKERMIKNASEFLHDWGGIVVVIEIPQGVDKSAETIVGDKLKNFIYVATALVILTFFILSKPSWIQAVHFGLSIAGIFVSILIVNHELGFKSKAVDKFCSGNESTSCDDVLNSKGATFFGFLKLSDLSIMYFLGLLCTSLIISANNALIFEISLLSIPVTLYSIYYQYTVVKKWCPLCLGIVAILWLQFSSFFISVSTVEAIIWSLTDITAVLLGFLLAASSWLLLRRLFIVEQAAKNLKIEHYRFKRNFDLFKAVVDKKPSLDITIHEIQENEIILGNSNAPLTALLITSPGCIHCKAAHTDLENILRKNPDKIKVIIRFSVYSEDKENMAYRVAARMLQLYTLEPDERVEEALHEIYTENADLEAWLVKWGGDITGAYDGILKIQQKWCHGNGINFTPTLYIQGKEFPSEYERTDLSFFIEDLVEQTEIIIGEENLETKKLTSTKAFL